MTKDPLRNEAFSSKVWVNGDGKIVGRQFGITDGTDTTPVFTWKAPSEGEDSALLLELAADDLLFHVYRKWQNSRWSSEWRLYPCGKRYRNC